MTIDVIALLVGGYVLYIGAEWLVKGSAGLARSFGIRPLVIGLTVVAYGTSAPELAVSTIAGIDGSSDLVLGNIMGSCIANIGLILGVTALLRPPRVDPGLIKKEIPFLVISAGTLAVVISDGMIQTWEAIAMVLGAIVFTLITLATAKNENTSQSLQQVETEAEVAGAPPGDGRLRLAIISAVGLGALLGGGALFVHGAKELALALGMSERVVGLTVVAIGTSVPELAACVIAAYRGHSALAVGNIIGSNIFNIFLVLGIVGWIVPSSAPITAPTTEMSLDLAVFCILTAICAFLLRKSRVVSRIEGGVLVSCYIAFIVVTVAGW